MNCPNCNTINEGGSVFCISCGQRLPEGNSGPTPAVAAPMMPAINERRVLGIATVRVVVAILLIWLVRSIILNLSFVEGLVLPDFPLTPTALLTIAAYVIILLLLFSYIQTLRALWPQAFPRLAGITPALMGVLYVIGLSWLYAAANPLFARLLDDPGDFFLVLRLVLLLLALLLLGWAAWVIYAALPHWLANMRFDVAPEVAIKVACLQCGRLNPHEASNCASCGKDLAAQQPQVE